MQVERKFVARRILSGKRVRNTLVTYPALRDNSPKGGLIPRIIRLRMKIDESRKTMWEGPMAHQLVGEVIAHQGYDG